MTAPLELLAYADAKVYKDGDNVGLTVDCPYINEGSSDLVDYDDQQDVVDEIARVKALPNAGGSVEGSDWAKFRFWPDPEIRGKFHFEAKHSDNSTYTWGWGDGHDLTPGEGADPFDAHVFDARGSHKVTLTTTRAGVTYDAWGVIFVKTAGVHGSG